MKKILLYLAFIGVAIVSCKKEHTKPPQSDLQKVTFTTGFSVSTGFIHSVRGLTTNSVGSKSAADTALTNHISELYYMVFDSTGHNVHYITQLSTDTAFGHYIDNLHPGKYTIAIGGSVETNFGASEAALTDAFYNNGLGDGSEFFFGQATFTVGSRPVSASVTLTRKSSKLIITIKDALPADPSAKINLTLNSVDGVFMVGSETFTGGQTLSLSYPVGNAAGTTNYQMVIPYYYISPFNLNITCENPNSKTTVIIYGQKTLTVNGGINQVTSLSGNLFGGQGTNQSGGFQTSLDTTWQTPVTVPFH